MFKFLVETFYFKSWTYTIEEPQNVIVERLEDLFENKDSLFKKPNLAGGFKEYPNTFSITPKWSLAYIKSFENASCYLKGSIHIISKDKTSLIVSIRSNSIFGLMCIMFTFSSIVCFYMAITTHGATENLIKGVCLLLFGIPLQIGLAIGIRTGIKRDFEEYMGINSY